MPKEITCILAHVDYSGPTEPNRTLSAETVKEITRKADPNRGIDTIESLKRSSALDFCNSPFSVRSYPVLTKTPTSK